MGMSDNGIFNTVNTLKWILFNPGRDIFFFFVTTCNTKMKWFQVKRHGFLLYKTYID